jgi:MFS family permease
MKHPALPDALPPRARRALAVLGLCSLLPALGTSLPNVGLPVLGRAFAAPYGELQWVVLAYLAASTVMAVPAGRLGDRYGHRRLLLGGIVLFTLASFACALSPSLPALALARAAQGCGAAAMMALTMPLAGAAVPAARSGMALGLLGTMSGAGTALGPALGGLLLTLGGWPALFLGVAPPGLLAFVLAWRWLPRATQARRAPAAAPAALPYGGLGATLLVASVVMTTLVAGPFHLSGALGLGSAAVGLAMSCGPLAAMLAGVPAGRAVDRHGPRPVMLAGLGAMAAGCALLALMPAGAGVAGYVAALCCTTTGYALFQAANNSALLRECAPGRRGAVSGLLNLARNLGLMAGAGAMGKLYTEVAAAAGAGAAMGASFGVAFVLVLAAVLLGLPARAPHET